MDGDTVCFPYRNGEKCRSGFKNGDRRFWFTKGVAPSLYFPPGEPPRGKVVILCEGETDTMRTWQELSSEAAWRNVSVVGIAGVDTWQSSFAADLESAQYVYIVLDNDADYNVQARVDAIAKQIRQDLGKKCRRVKLPGGVKDMCEFWDTYDIETLRLMLQKGRQTSRFRPLDLNIKPPPPRWLWEPYLALGDVHLLSGPSGIGKSWLTMALAAAVADGDSSFLAKALCASGRVLYFDEENPEDVVYDRLTRLGLKNKQNIRYIWNNAVRLDRDADALLDEALDYEPALIVLDAFTRFHSLDENAAGQMAPLLNNVVKPLARETGAAVVVIHHHTRSGEGPRGSSDITASPDTTFEVEKEDDGYRLRMTKSRRTSRGPGMFIAIRDLPDGAVELQTPAPVDTTKVPL